MDNHQEALKYAKLAAQVDPQEGQAAQMQAVALLESGRPAEALMAFTRYNPLLPGTPDPTYFKGLCYELMGNKRAAAQHYLAYRNAVHSGEFRKRADQRLLKWGVLQPVQQPQQTQP